MAGCLVEEDAMTAHAGLAIAAEEWETNLQYADAALIKNGVADAERAEFLALFERYRGDIVE